MKLLRRSLDTLAALLLITLAACSPQQRQTTRTLTDLGLSVAVASGKLSPGDSLVIGQGVAILTEEGTTTQKAVSLASLGLLTATQRGLLKPGDALLIGQASAIITTQLLPEPLPAALPSGK